MTFAREYMPRFSWPANSVFSRIRVETRGNHDHVRLWNAGALAGELVLRAGDGQMLAEHLQMVAPEPDPETHEEPRYMEDL